MRHLTEVASLRRDFDFGNHFNEWAGFDADYTRCASAEADARVPAGTQLHDILSTHATTLCAAAHCSSGGSADRDCALCSASLTLHSRRNPPPGIRLSPRSAHSSLPTSAGRRRQRGGRRRRRYASGSRLPLPQLRSVVRSCLCPLAACSLRAVRAGPSASVLTASASLRLFRPRCPVRSSSWTPCPRPLSLSPSPPTSTGGSGRSSRRGHGRRPLHDRCFCGCACACACAS